LSLHYCAVEKFNHSRSFLHCIFEQTLRHFRSTLSQKSVNTEMVRVRSTARVSHEGDEAQVAETAPISKVMKQSGVVVPEEAVAEGTSIAKAEQIAVGGSDNEDEEDYTILSPAKPSHLEFGKSTVTADDMVMMKKLGYFGEAESKLIRFASEEVILEPKDDEVVVFKSFFRAGLRFPQYDIIGGVLKNFEIYLHQLTPNAIVRLSVYIWALRSQGMSPNAEAFCRVHELHYQRKARVDGLHENFGCYNFAYRKDMKAPVLSYHTKWPTGWRSEWFYIKADEKRREKLMTMVMSPLKLSFGMTRPLCHMQLGSPCQVAKVEFIVVAAEVNTWDLVQEYLANRVFPTSSGWGMPKKKDGGKKHKLVWLPYCFKFEKEFKKPCQEWLEMNETMCCCAVEKFNHSRSFLHCIFEQTLRHFRSTLSQKSVNTEMVRVRSTARVSHEGDEAQVAETAPISEVMKQSGLVVPEEAVAEGTSIAKAEQIAVGGSDNEDEEDYTILSPAKPSHLEFGKSTVTADDMVMMKKLGYFGEAESKLIRFASEEVILEPKDDEVVVFKSFFRAGLRFPLYDIIGGVLKNFEIYLHQLTPNAIVRLSVYIWALRSQGMSPNAEAFCRVHELHYQRKARVDGLHENFGCYNFAYRKDMKAPVLSYHTKWPTGWRSEWFYIKADEERREKLMTMVMSPLKLSFGMTRPLCHMQLGSPCQVAEVEFIVVAAKVNTWDLVQEYLAN
jgi:ribosomal protein S17